MRIWHNKAGQHYHSYRLQHITMQRERERRVEQQRGRERERRRRRERKRERESEGGYGTIRLDNIIIIHTASGI